VTRRLPVLPTLLLLAAVAVMIRLGFWQLDRLHEKEALLARYGAATGKPDLASWPKSPAEAADVLYRHSTVDCLLVRDATWKAGANEKGEAGLARFVECRTREGNSATVVLGWSREPVKTDWAGGKVTGTIAPGPRLVADRPMAGLEANARPDPRNIPNNHLSYAVQWFLFAATALVIYALALRKRLAGAPPRR
jgi:cytochrome oxidase assembly protein ShyY1